LKNWVDKAATVVTLAIEKSRSHGDRCLLLDARAMLGSVPSKSDLSVEEHQTRFFDLWRDVVREIKETPYYPVTHVADILENFTPVVGTHPRFRSLADQVDILIAERAGAAAAADRARGRAVAHLDAGRHVAAIDELQRAKVGWFTGETMEGSILAMMVISQSFDALNLHLAARYYAAGAFYLTLRDGREPVSRRLSQSAITLADTFHSAGEGITFFYSIGQALMAHEAVATDHYGWTKHGHVRRTVGHAMILRAIARRVAPDLLPLIDEAIAKWPLPEGERGALISLSEQEPWSTMPTAEIEKKVADELGQYPFGDVGNPRSATWSAFGVTWTVQGSADRESWLAALEVAATLQIAQVEFAEVDLLVIPSHAVLNVQLGDVAKPQISQLPDNGPLAWQIMMPRHYPEAADSNEIASHSAAIAITVLGQATALTFRAFQDLIEQRFERGFAQRLFSVRPARELMAFAWPESLDSAVLSSSVRPVFGREINPIEAEELQWRTGPGPGYSRARAEEYLRNRYDLLSRAIKCTLPRLLSDDHCSRIIAKLQKDGLLDWQILAILANIVAQYQIEPNLHIGLDLGDMSKKLLNRIRREERDDDPQFDLSHLTVELVKIQKDILSAAAFKTWDLESHRATPDFVAMKQLLDQRYGHSSDDIVHDDPFQSLGEKRPTRS
jgi:hypothetical protein